jgi:hypothetical protein
MDDKFSIVALSPSKIVADTDIRRDLGGVSRMTTHRWDRDPNMTAIGWPPPISINGRLYRDLQLYECFRARLAREAIRKRATLIKQPLKGDGAPA